ncbi:hypothetical protein CKAH01_08024 [Colletotrichum kahawae]|uniref:Uncharacterized protein n=1 Tax=Colletotrichum kahawae TaxID=34407 RepID=A0AAE0D288_COLKA|nr:hypothetical protein CKAH01_08024 [Colletotrichum kahawae]
MAGDDDWKKLNISLLMSKKQLSLAQANRAVDEFFDWKKHHKRESLSGLTGVLIQRVSVILSDCPKSFDLTDSLAGALLKWVGIYGKLRNGSEDKYESGLKKLGVIKRQFNKFEKAMSQHEKTSETWVETAAKYGAQEWQLPRDQPRAAEARLQQAFPRMTALGAMEATNGEIINKAERQDSQVQKEKDKTEMLLTEEGYRLDFQYDFGTMTPVSYSDDEGYEGVYFNVPGCSNGGKEIDRLMGAKGSK